MHPTVRDPEHVKGLRAVATVEFTKGVVVVLAGLGLFSVRHRDIWGVAESFLEFFHVNPYHHYVGIFIDLVYRVSDMRLWKIAVVASIYAILRFVEAFGLWYGLPWVEWMAILTGAVYIPFEAADLLRRATWLGVAVIAVNTFVVLYLLYVRLEAERKRLASRRQPEQA